MLGTYHNPAVPSDKAEGRPVSACCTLILAEVIVPLTRQQTLERFRPADLQAAGLKEADVKEGTAGLALHAAPDRALPRRRALRACQTRRRIVSSPATCGPRGCSYGGAAVAIRVLRGPSATGAAGLYVVDSVVEPADVKGDCFYVPRDTRQSLHCKSLDSQGGSGMAICS